MNLKSLFFLLRNVQVRTVKKGEILIEKGASKKELFYIRKGLIRSYFVSDNLEEITFHLFGEARTFGNVHAILFDEPSKFYYQAIERTKVYTIDYEAFYELATKDPKLYELNRDFIGKKVLRQAFQRIESLVLLSPEERYLKYMEDHPNIINRAPDKYIANVLGITPVSLSRIRKRILEKNSIP